jgi:hypothetical protein
MHTGASVCRRCNQKHLSCYELNCDSDTYRFHQRVDELGAHIHPKRSHPLLAAVLVMSVAGLSVIAYQIQCHPGGPIARQAKSIISGFLPAHKQAIAHKSSKSKTM